jgi:hypothetical protein
MLCFFRSLIDFDWIKGHLISGQVGSGRIRVGSDRVGFGSDRIRVRTGRTDFSDRIGFCHHYSSPFEK